jgi:hypothetical protein
MKIINKALSFILDFCNRRAALSLEKAYTYRVARGTTKFRKNRMTRMEEKRSLFFHNDDRAVNVSLYIITEAPPKEPESRQQVK